MNKTRSKILVAVAMSLAGCASNPSSTKNPNPQEGDPQDMIQSISASRDADISTLSCDELRRQLCYERARRLLAVAEIEPLDIIGHNEISVEGAAKKLTSIGGSLVPGGSMVKMIGNEAFHLAKKQDYTSALLVCDAEYGKPGSEPSP